MSFPIGESTLSSDGSPRASYLRRILDVLETVALGDEASLTVTSIASRAGVPLSTTSRLLAQLVSWDFLVDRAGGHYAPGPRLIRIAVRTLDTLHGAEELHRSTEALCSETGESVTAGVVMGDHLMIIARTEPAQQLRAVSRVGEIIPPSRTALGKAVLAQQEPDRRLAVLRAEAGDQAEDVLAGIATELERARKDGYARDEEQYEVGLRCRAAAIIGRYGAPVAGISIGGPSARFTPELAAEAARALLMQVARLSADIDSLEARLA